MMNRTIVKRIGSGAVLLLLAQCFFPATALACPLCQDQLSQPQALAFSVSALFLVSMPFMLVAFIGSQLARALNPEAYQRVYSRVAGMLTPRWIPVAIGLVVLALVYVALTPADAAPARPLPRAQFVDKVNFTGRSIAAGQLDNKVVVVNFFASWCEACQAEVADLGDLYLEFRDSAPGVEVIGIAFDFEHQDDLSTQPHVHPDGTVHYHGLPNTLQVLLTFLKANRAAYAVIPYTSDIAQAFGDVRAIPATFVFNRQGLLSKKYVGPPSLALLKADVQQLLKQ